MNLHNLFAFYSYSFFYYLQPLLLFGMVWWSQLWFCPVANPRWYDFVMARWDSANAVGQPKPAALKIVNA